VVKGEKGHYNNHKVPEKDMGKKSIEKRQNRCGEGKWVRGGGKSPCLHFQPAGEKNN